MNLEQTLQQTPKIIIQFTAPWCGPCKMMQPMINELKSNGDIVLEGIDVETQSDIAEKYDIRSVPTFIFFKDGVEQQRVRGVQTQKFMKESFKSL